MLAIWKSLKSFQSLPDRFGNYDETTADGGKTSHNSSNCARSHASQRQRIEAQYANNMKRRKSAEIQWKTTQSVRFQKLFIRVVWAESVCVCVFSRVLCARYDKNNKVNFSHPIYSALIQHIRGAKLRRQCIYKLRILNMGCSWRRSQSTPRQFNVRYVQKNKLSRAKCKRDSRYCL